MTDQILNIEEQVANAATAEGITTGEMWRQLLCAVSMFGGGVKPRKAPPAKPVRLGLGWSSVEYTVKTATFLFGTDAAAVTVPIVWEAVPHWAWQGEWRVVPRVLPHFAPPWGPELRTCPHCGVRGPFEKKPVTVGTTHCGGSWDECTCRACGKTYDANIWID